MIPDVLVIQFDVSSGDWSYGREYVYEVFNGPEFCLYGKKKCVRM